MSVRINAPVINNFTIKTLVETYPVAPNVTVQSGDLLYFYTEGDTVYVTNKVTSTDGEVKAIAMNTRTYPETVSCYIIIYRARHDDLTRYPHILLSQFTHMELSRLYLPKQISTNCDAISRQTCDLLNQYTCDNLNTYGVREYPLL